MAKAFLKAADPGRPAGGSGPFLPLRRFSEKSLRWPVLRAEVSGQIINGESGPDFQGRVRVGTIDGRNERNGLRQVGRASSSSRRRLIYQLEIKLVQIPQPTVDKFGRATG